MKVHLIAKFNEAKKFDRIIIKRWFVRHVKNIYDELYSQRVIKKVDKLTEYTDFRFFNRLFVGSGRDQEFRPDPALGVYQREVSRPCRE